VCVCVCVFGTRGVDMKQVPYGGLTNIRFHHKTLVALATWFRELSTPAVLH
jgi:hypothetical protein